MSELLTPVVMCGGAGTRLWPVSRETMPKQFVPLIGERSTFQQTLQRLADPIFTRPIVIAHTDFRFIVAEQLREVGIEADIVLEPARRDSGPAVAVAALIAGQRDQAANVIVLAADHVVRNTDAFVKSCEQAVGAVRSGRIVTFGIRPTGPNTSYGYIRPGAKLNGGAARAVEAFVEKPDPATADRYIADEYLWNSGIFIFRSDVMLQEIERFEPAIVQAARAATAALEQDLDFLRLSVDGFSQAPKKSIDYAVMEKTTLASVIEAEWGWSDVGGWDAVWEQLERDENGNAISGPATVLDTKNSLVRSDGSILTAVVGIENAIIVATDDALLVAARTKAEQVKALVEHLKSHNRREAVEHRRVYRPWGYYQGTDSGDRYQVKRIVVKPGARLSLQKHFHRAEHWVVVRGTAEVTVGEDARVVHENESVYIPIGSRHRLINPGKIPLELIEIQVGSYLGEDDIQRFDDIYGRR